ncbi:Beta-13-galactosyltransferase 2 [Taenia solium]|eukprot:TsM_000550900 transcript=TsM_000550900 gene=TsM_000550900
MFDKWISFKDKGEYAQSIWQPAIYPNVHRTYPQDVPIRYIVKAIKADPPVFERDLSPNTKLKIVLGLGMPRQHGGLIFNCDGHTTILGGPSDDVMMDAYVGRSNEVMQKVEEEVRKYDDMLLAHYNDTHYNLPWKTVTKLRWISVFCDEQHNDIFMISDADYRLIGADIVDDMAVGSACTRHNYVHEGVYEGLVAFKLGIPLSNV